MSNDNRKLTVREQKFVEVLASGKADTVQDAVIKADYKPTTEKSLKNMGYEIINRPQVRSALAAAIKARYADIEDKVGGTVHDILVNEQNNPLVRLKAVEVLMKIFDWAAPSKHLTLNAKADFKLPEE